MKKIAFFLSMLMLLTISMGNMWADEVTFAFGDYKGQGTSSTGSAYTMADKGDVSIGDTKFYGNNSYAHFYANGVTTITPASGVTITKIVLTASAASYNGYQSSGTMTWSTGSSSADGAVVTWTGSATAAFTLSHNKQIRWTSIDVTYSKESGSTPICATPTFSPAAGSYEGTQNVTISSTAGATIYYTTDGSTPSTSSSVYSSPIAVNADMTIKAYAVKANYDDSEVATAAYTITEGPDVNLNLVDGNWGFPVNNTTKLTEYTNSVTGYKVSCYAATAYKVSDSSYFIIGKNGSYITLPKFSSPVEKIVVVGKSGGSGSVKFNIFDGDSPVSTEAIGCTTDKTFEIEDPAANKQYKLKVTSNHNLQLKAIKFYFGEAPAVAKPTISGEENFVGSTSVTISQADVDHVYYTTDNTEPTPSSTEYTAPFTLTNTATVKAIAVKGSDVSDVAEKTFTKVTVMTVPEAKAAIDAAGSTPIENQYVTGIISQIDSYNSTYHSIQYWISADGTTTDQLEVYSGKGLNGANFAGISDLSLGDEVIVKGTLKKYSSTYEFDMNSQIVQLNRTIAAPTFTPNGGGFLTTLNVSLASATEGAEVRYTTDGSDPTSTSTLYENSIELSSTTTIKAAAFKGEFVSVIVTKTFTKGTKIAVAVALDALNSSSPIADQFVYGKISTAPTSNPNNGRLTYKISDDGTTTDELEVYNGFGLNGAEFSDKTDLQVGDDVTVYGTLKIYNEKKEFDAGNYLLEFNRPEVQTYSITYEENGGAEVADVAEATNLPDPLPTTTKDDKAFGGWFTDAEFNTPAVAGAALTSNVTLYAKWNDVSAWAAVYTSNVTLSKEGGTNASAAKVRLTSDGTEYDALKAGTSSKSGAVVVTVPDGATKLHFHAYGWSGESVTLSVTAPDGVTVSPSSVKIAANTGVSSNSPFTLAEGSAPQLEAYFAVTLSGNTDETALTFTATSGKRFVLFGVNHEGGAIPASIAVNPTSLAFGSVEQDAEVEAKTINVTLTEVAAATVALTGDGASAFNIDKSSLTASGVITVTPNTTNVGTYAATITISDNASAVDPVVVNVSMTVTEPIVADDLSGTWALVTDASQLVAGKKVIIAEAVESDGEAKTMGVQNNNNRAAVVSTVASGILTPNVATKTFTLADAGNSKWALQGTDSKYLYAASSNSNYLKSQDEIDDNATWTIGIENSKAAITANGTNTRNIIRFNSSSSLFSCYASGQNDIALYIQQQEDTPIDPEQSFEDVRTGLEIGRHYTICMPKKIVAIDGATFWGINNCDEGKTSVYLEMQQPPFEAGTPFIFYATATTLKVAYEGEETATPIENGALHGTFVDMNHAALEAAGNQVYLMYQNALHPLGTNNHLDANRAYLLFEELVPGTPAPGRQVKRMPMHTNITTGIENIEASDRPTKMLIDGKMFIRCSEKLYDATGSLVK